MASSDRVAAADQASAAEVVVEQSPLRTRFIRSHNRFVLSWPDDSTLVIKNHLGVRVVGWGLCILGWPILLFGLLGIIGGLMKPEDAQFVAAGLLLLGGGAFVLMGVWLLGPRYRFDTADGWLTVRHFWRTRRLPLARINAVQMIDAGRFGTRYGGLDADKVEFSSYQLNLVLDDASERRMFVTYNSDFTDMARKAKILADFLGVPLVAEPKVHELVQTFRGEDARGPAGTIGAGRGRFRGSDALRSVPDDQLPEPYWSWIDEAQPLPAQVRLLPRSVSVLGDLGLFVILGVMIIGMDVLVLGLFMPALAAAGGWVAIAVVGAFCLLLALIPLFLLRRLIITLGAWRRLARGTLRQGIFVGPEGVLVRMEPNRCYAIALDRFANARVEKGTSASVPSDFVIETLDGPVAFFLDRSSGRPEQIAQWVAELRPGSEVAGDSK